MKQTFKTLALVTLIGGSLTACNSNDGVAPAPMDDMSSVVTPDPSDPSITGTATITSGGGTGTAKVTATLDNVNLINTALYLNGAERFNAKITYTVDGTLTTALDTERTLSKTKSGTVTLYATNDKDYRFSENVTDEEGNEYVVSGILDIGSGELRQDVGVVKGYEDDENSNPYYITNTGTGEVQGISSEDAKKRDDHINNYILKGDKSGRMYAYHDALITAQAEGWTGSGISVESTVNAADSEELIKADKLLKVIAPNSTTNTVMGKNDSALIGNSYVTTDKISIGTTTSDRSNYDLENYYVSSDPMISENEETTLVAGGVALVWNKFHTLDDQQMIRLVEQTSDNKRFILKDALSPVGNLK